MICLLVCSFPFVCCCFGGLFVFVPFFFSFFSFFLCCCCCFSSLFVCLFCCFVLFYVSHWVENNQQQPYSSNRLLTRQTGIRECRWVQKQYWLSHINWLADLESKSAMWYSLLQPVSPSCICENVRYSCSCYIPPCLPHFTSSPFPRLHFLQSICLHYGWHN